MFRCSRRAPSDTLDSDTNRRMTVPNDTVLVLNGQLVIWKFCRECFQPVLRPRDSTWADSRLRAERLGFVSRHHRLALYTILVYRAYV